MAQLFKCKTVKQKKIERWLVGRGIHQENIQRAEFLSSDMIRVTNPAGKYMDIYCNELYTVRILSVTQARENELHQLWEREANNCLIAKSWRKSLTPDETVIVKQWDRKAHSNIKNFWREKLWMKIMK